MASLNNVASGDSANSTCIQQVIDILKGTAGAGNIPVSLTAINDSVNFALSVQNLEATNQRSFRVLDSSGSSRLQFDTSGPQADPTDSGLAPIVVTTATQTLTNKTLNQLNTGAPGNVLKLPQARVAHTSTQTLTSGVGLALTFNTIRWDNDSLHSTTTNPSRLTPSRPGLWAFGGTLAIDINSSGQVGVSLRVTGATVVAAQQVQNNAAGQQILNVGTQYQLSTSDYVEMVAFQNSGGNLGTVVSANQYPEFWACYLGSS